MIIFYEKNTGTITGKIDGRVHSDIHLKMWMGAREETERVVINWKKTKSYTDQKGNVIAYDYEPDHPQPELIKTFEKNFKEVYSYKVEKGLFVKK